MVMKIVGEIEKESFEIIFWNSTQHFDLKL